MQKTKQKKKQIKTRRNTVAFGTNLLCYYVLAIIHPTARNLFFFCCCCYIVLSASFDHPLRYFFLLSLIRVQKKEGKEQVTEMTEGASWLIDWSIEYDAKPNWTWKNRPSSLCFCSFFRSKLRSSCDALRCVSLNFDCDHICVSLIIISLVSVPFALS